MDTKQVANLISKLKTDCVTLEQALRKLENNKFTVMFTVEEANAILDTLENYSNISESKRQDCIDFLKERIGGVSE